MKVVWLTRFGAPEVLEPGTAPDPVPGPGQVVVRVAYAGVTFVETQFRATGFGPFGAELPRVPGNGVGGTVTATGPGVDRGLLGRRVVASLNGAGGYAEQVAVDATHLLDVPDTLALDLAVALVADGRTALLVLEDAAVVAGELVLVEAAGGGVGSLLVQLAVTAGAHVVAAAGSPRKLEVARSLGAHELVDYREAGWTEQIPPLDVVLDGVGGDVGHAAAGLLRPGGRLLSYGLAGGSWTEVPDAGLRGITVLRSRRRTPEELRVLSARALQEAAAGLLRPVIGQTFPLAEAGAAHAEIENRRTVGKTLLVP